MAHNYKTELEEACRELGEMLAFAEQFQDQIAKQKRKVAALSELADVSEDSPAPLGLVEGITDAVRTVFRSAEKPLNPAEVRTRVEALGLPAQKNILASIHTIIRRLLESKEIEVVGDIQFGGGYRWIKRASWMPTMDPEKMRAALGRDPTPLEIARNRFAHAHEAKSEREKNKELRPQERFSLDHTRPTKPKQD
jgi:hypothetical protein